MTDTGWKIFNSDLTSPVQNAPAVWDGSLPFTLPKVALDTSGADCGSGWNYCPRMADAIKISGLWRTGRPSYIVQVEPVGTVVHRKEKSRSDQLQLLRYCTSAELEAGVREFSKALSPHEEFMVFEQREWHRALGRPLRDATVVKAAVTAALKARGLNWKLRRFDSVQAAWDAWDAGAARAAWDAGAALTLGFASCQGWVNHDPLLLTVGLRDAYLHGLETAIPIGPNELGWTMAE